VNHELEIQKLLRSGQTPEQICEPLGIEIRRKDGKVLFSYDQIASIPFKLHPVVKECRGLILYEDNWDVCSMAFSRFLNHGETGADELPTDLNGCYVLEKLDGSMVSMYWDRNDKKWHCSTRSMIDAEGMVNGVVEKMTFADLFWKALDATGFDRSNTFLSPDWTYVFELTSPFNRVVTRFKDIRATLLTCRRTSDTLWECTRSGVEVLAEEMGWPVVRAIDARNAEELLKMENEDGSAKDPEFEGYVIVKEGEPHHSRVKMKNPSYLALHRIASSVSERNLMELVKAGKQDDLLARFPEYTDKINFLADGLNAILYTVTTDWMGIKDIQDRKEFALQAKKCKLPHFLFALKDGRMDNCSVMDYIRTQRTDSLLECIQKLSYKESAE